jgi:hypothetical protein
MADHRFAAWARLDPGLAGAVAVVVAGAAAVALGIPQPVRALATVGLVVWAPGYALTRVVFAPGAISGVERAVLAFATSVALTAIPAVALDAIGVRLGTASFLITSCVVTSVAAALAQRRLPAPVAGPLLPRLPRPPLAPLVTAVTLVAILAGTLVVARITPRAEAIPGSSVLAATIAGPSTIHAEVISAELRATTYRLETLTPTGRVELARFTLRPGGVWRSALDAPAGSGPVDLLLYRDTERRPYRHVVLRRAPA